MPLTRFEEGWPLPTYIVYNICSISSNFLEFIPGHLFGMTSSHILQQKSSLSVNQCRVYLQLFKVQLSIDVSTFWNNLLVNFTRCRASPCFRKANISKFLTHPSIWAKKKGCRNHYTLGIVLFLSPFFTIFPHQPLKKHLSTEHISTYRLNFAEFSIVL